MNGSQHALGNPRAIDVEYLLSRLSPQLRQVAILRFFEDLSYEDLAAALDLPLWKARKRLAELLWTLRDFCGVQVCEIALGNEVRYLPNFLPEPEADIWLARLSAEVPFQSETVTMHGKQFVLKRQTAQYGRNYRYNPTAHNARDWSPLLTDLRILVQDVIGTQFHAALCNLYPDGKASIGWHQDADHPKIIASLSLGAVRELRFAETGSTRTVYGMELAHGSLLLIPERVNDRYKHMVPKSKHVTQPRINVTFRRFCVA